MTVRRIFLKMTTLILLFHMKLQIFLSRAFWEKPIIKILTTNFVRFLKEINVKLMKLEFKIGWHKATRNLKDFL